MTENSERLVNRLEPLTAKRLKEFTIGEVNLFEKMTKVDFDFFWRNLMPVTPLLDEHGFEQFDSDGNPILVADKEALKNPQPIPGKTGCLAAIVWLVNRENVEGLTVGRLEAEVSYAEMWSLLNKVTQNPDEVEVEPAIQLEGGDPLTEAPTTGADGTAPVSASG